MLHYPKIPDSRNAPSGTCLAFEKYDGTNLHFDYDRDFGFHSFGTRRDAFNLTPDGIAAFIAKHAHLAECVDVFRATLAAGLEKVFREHVSYREVQTMKVFAEFLGPGSFAGLHKAAEAKELRLFDVLVEPGGIIPPKQFVADFGHLPIARVVYEGKLTGQFAEDVRAGKCNVAEGVVCKGVTRGTPSEPGTVWMFKIKTNAYMEKLKQAFAEKWEAYWE